ncbi:Ankyrin repeat-containing domain protein [Cordyceps fumosorosea ARSEF 2679]|uniref:Ankyrin repeat-containing domain protein n=1 Tax=Cordyceps fumosorosea (strain ARSEF 2679) TaxID=1081104 RepID=A0A167MCB7_CORFA|nr:Ankyrin repeat-containing domain protein [Cordyceps fumosorosea ARSEF 2679]OAA54194.1 Ankyrin repeat-containing domain protein [Cordyceps fumosorosea ARSEF 2679]
MDSTTHQLLPVDANGGEGPELPDPYAAYRVSIHALHQQNYDDHASYAASFPTSATTTDNHTTEPVPNGPITDAGLVQGPFTDLLREGWATSDGDFFLSDFATTSHELPPDESSQEVVATSLAVDSPNHIAIAPLQSTPQPSQQEWNSKKLILKRLYIEEKKTAREIVEIMKLQHNFHASIDHYRSKFRKWEFMKYLGRDEKRKIVQIMNWRRRMEGKETEFFVDNQRVSEEKIARFIRTYGNPASAPPDDLEVFEAFRSHEFEVNLECFQRRAFLLLAAEHSTRVPAVACHDCGFLYASVSQNSLASIFEGTLPILDMTDSLLVAVLRLAIQNRDDALVKHLVHRCQQPELAQRIHRHLFCVALQHDRGTLFCQLLLHGLDVNAVDGGRATANRSLLAQAHRTLREFIMARLDSNDNMNDTARVMGFMYRTGVMTPDFWKDKVLWKALRNGRADVLRACLLQPTNAVLDIDALIKKAAKIRRIIQETGSSETAAVLVAAASHNRHYLVSEKGAAVLHLATSLLLANEVRLLLEGGVDVNEKTEMGETALHIIAGLPSDGNHVAKILIDRGADVTATDSVGDTVLHKAARHKWEHWQKDFALMLLEKGADINALNHRRETPLIAAAQNPDFGAATEAMKWLLQNRANPSALDCDGNSAVTYYKSRAWVNQLGAWEGSTMLEQPWNWSALGEQQETWETSQRADLLRDLLRSLGFPPM